MAEKVRARVLISGRVQGVFFRHETAQRARSRGVSGWVSNRPDGRVEAVFEGERAAVEELVRWCHQGPSLATVQDVDVAWEAPAGDQRFAIR